MHKLIPRVLVFICLISGKTVFPQSNFENYTYKLNASTDAVRLWTTTPANKVLKEDAVPDATAEVVNVYCAKNEFEPFVLVINPRSDIEISITMDSFSADVETQLNQVHYTYLAKATDALGTDGYFPDALKPVGFGQKITIPANENTAFWFTVKVSENATGATDYTANIQINNITVPVKLHVFDFSISEELHVKSQMNFSHQSIISKYGLSGTGDEYWTYVDNIKQYFIDHRLTPKSVLWSGGLTTKGAEPYID